MSFDPEDLPALHAWVAPPIVRGTADLAGFAYGGHDLDALLAYIGPSNSITRAAYLFDTAIAFQLSFRRAEGLDRLDAALTNSPMFRVAGKPGGGRRLRLLALCAPGDLMVNTPLDFITNELDVQLDLLYLLSDRPLPPVIPDHDVAFFAVGEADPRTLVRLQDLFDRWPRPALNDPRALPALARDALSRSLAACPGICSPTAVAVSRSELDVHLRTGRPITGFETPRGLYPCLIRPAGSHAGAGLSCAATPAELADYLRLSFERNFFVTAFEDYRGPAGLYRKSRVAFIDRQPFLCHMAISHHWMVHYLNAGMTESAQKRAQEAAAMADFDDDFARRHAAAFAALHDRLGFDYYSIDCAETQDGRLLVFEADTAAIIHLMDPPDLFPYKKPQMQRVFQAFGAMLNRAARTATIRDRQTVAADPV